MSFPGCHNLPYRSSDYIHLGCGEAVSPRKIARRAGLSHIAFYVRQSVIDPIQTAWDVGRAAVYTRLRNEFQNFGSCKVTIVYPLVGFAKKYGAAFVRFGVLSISLNSLLPLFWRHVRPSFVSAVAPFLSRAVTGLTLVRQPKRACPLTMEVFRSCGECSVATEASAGRHSAIVYGPHRNARSVK